MHTRCGPRRGRVTRGGRKASPGVTSVTGRSCSGASEVPRTVRYVARLDSRRVRHSSHDSAICRTVGVVSRVPRTSAARARNRLSASALPASPGRVEVPSMGLARVSSLLSRTYAQARHIAGLVLLLGYRLTLGSGTARTVFLTWGDMNPSCHSIRSARSHW